MSKIKNFLSFIMWSSPILKLIFNTTEAISDGYHERLIIDPGHTRIKFFDKLIICLTWITASVLTVNTVIHNGSLSDLYNVDIYAIYALLQIIFFPYFSNIFISILLYINTIVLSIYNKNRHNIIRNINEKEGVW